MNEPRALHHEFQLFPGPRKPGLVLYYSPGACSLAAHIALRESGLRFELLRARIPALDIYGTPVTELSAILGWIGDHSRGLAPPRGTLESIQCAEWLAWFTSAVHVSFALIWRGERFLDDTALHPLLRKKGLATLRRQLAEIEAWLAAHDYLVADRYSVADCNALVFYRWASRAGLDVCTEYPAWTLQVERLLQRPAVSAAVEVEGIDIWARPEETAPTGGNARIAATARRGARH